MPVRCENQRLLVINEETEAWNGLSPPEGPEPLPEEEVVWREDGWEGGPCHTSATCPRPATSSPGPFPLLPFLVRKCCCLMLGHDLTPRRWTTFPHGRKQKAVGRGVWFPECTEWWQPRQMIWTEREIHPPPPPEEKQKGHHGNCSVLD